MVSTLTQRPPLARASKNPGPASPKSLSLNPFDRICRWLVLRKLSALAGESVTIVLSHKQVTLSKPDAGLSATVHVHHPRFFRRLLQGGDLGAADSLIAGEWTCDDLTALVRLFIVMEQTGQELNGPISYFRQLASRLVHWRRSNSIGRARRNISEHYDLGNDFYRLWLDETMTYSSGIFETSRSTMKEASITKMDRLCRKLNLRPGDHLLEIGTGWGALAVHAARNYGCRVTTTTISDEQFEFAAARIAEAGLSDRITLLKKDYRRLTGRYDKLVSVEMIEAVGHAYYATFFDNCSRLLKDNGTMMIQAIVIADQHYEQHIRSADFISQYIFPGGSLPSISVLTATAATAADMRLIELDDFAPHYAETLRRWRDEFFAHLQEIRGQGFDERFIRMWEYYLCYCEAAFEECKVNLVQMRFAKQGHKEFGFDRSSAGGVNRTPNALAQPKRRESIDHRKEFKVYSE